MSHWRKQQQRDPYFRQAKQEGYRARSAYKLLQLQERFRIVRHGDTVVDLGAAPGSWSQVAVKLVGAKGRVVALDLQEIEVIPGVITLQGDMTDPATQAQVVEAAGGQANVIVSDAAPSTSGIKLRDHALSMELTRAALTLAQTLLIPGGHMVVKVFEGPDLQDVLQEYKAAFRSARISAPKASRKESRETFIIAQKYKGS